MIPRDRANTHDDVVARVWEALEGVIDPELGLDVVTLGLVYEVRSDGGRVRVVHTLTTPGCPMGEHLTRVIREAAASVEGVERVDTEVTWEPSWDPSMIDDDADKGGESTGSGKSPGGEPRPPPPLRSLGRVRIRDLDVREQLRRGEEPFERIMSAAAELPPDGVLRVRALFEPEPLYGVMEGRGFEHWTERLGEEDWRVWFHRPGDSRPSADEQNEEEPMNPRTADAAQGPHLLDVRRLDGPDKHPTIHRMFEELEPGQSLTLVNDHEPKPLFYELEAEMPELFDGEGYRAYEAADRVWVAILPRRA